MIVMSLQNILLDYCENRIKILICLALVCSAPYSLYECLPRGCGEGRSVMGRNARNSNQIYDRVVASPPISGTVTCNVLQIALEPLVYFTELLYSDIA